MDWAPGELGTGQMAFRSWGQGTRGSFRTGGTSAPTLWKVWHSELGTGELSRATLATGDRELTTTHGLGTGQLTGDVADALGTGQGNRTRNSTKDQSRGALGTGDRGTFIGGPRSTGDRGTFGGTLRRPFGSTGNAVTVGELDRRIGLKVVAGQHPPSKHSLADAGPAAVSGIPSRSRLGALCGQWFDPGTAGGLA